MERAEFMRLCAENFNKNGISVFATENITSKLFDLCEIFLQTNKIMNLTAIRDERLCISLHFADCLLTASLFPFGTNVLDVGSGGGMPTLPLAIARPDLKITALDATAKKTEYIKKTAQTLGLSNVDTVTGRAEVLAHTNLRESFDCVTARAVAQTNVLIEWCAPFVKVGGLFIALKGKQGGEEAKSAVNAAKKLGCSLTLNEPGKLYDLNGTVSDRHTLVYKKISSTDGIFPRKNAQIVKNPL